MNSAKLNSLLSTCQIKSIHEITSDKWLVNYIPIIDSEICLEHNIDYLKAITNNKNLNVEKNIDVFEDVSVIVAALITSYARVFMLQILLDILNKGGVLFTKNLLL